MRALLSRKKHIPGLILTGLAIATFVVGLVGAQDFRDISRWFPMGVSVVGIVLALATLLWELGIVTVGSSEGLEGDATEGDGESSMTPVRGFLTYMTWLVVFIASLMTVGAVISIFLWLVFFFRFRSKEGWVRSILYSLAAVVVVTVLTSVLHLFIPTGWLLPSGSWIPQINIRF